MTSTASTCGWMATILRFGTNIIEELDRAWQARLNSGGYTLLFLSRGAVSSPWVAHEVERTLETFPEQILIAALDDPASFGSSLIENWISSKRRMVPLYTASSNEIDYRRVDDVITSLYWLIQHRGGERKGRPGFNTLSSG